MSDMKRIVADKSDLISSVTPHALTPSLDGSKLLLCGIDSLDMGIYVRWGYEWEQLKDRFDHAKSDAYYSKGITDQTADGRSFLHLSKGMEPNYHYHLAFPEYHLFIAKSK